VDGTKELLRRLAASDERSIRDVLTGRPCAHGGGLDRVARALVQLAAMVAVDAPTTSLRWAVDVASGAGVDDAALVRVLVSAASATGAAQTVASAPRLALAVGVDLEVDGWDGT
jgi:alkylhydroperoxidase family enzyme